MTNNDKKNIEAEFISFVKNMPIKQNHNKYEVPAKKLFDDVFYKKIFIDYANNVDSSEDTKSIKKNIISIDNLKKAALLLDNFKNKKIKKNQFDTVKYENVIMTKNFFDIDDINSEPLDENYRLELIRRCKPYKKKYYPRNDPNQYLKPKNKKVYGPYKDLRSKSTILSDLNLNDKDIKKDLYKYDRGRNKYKKFKYPITDRLLRFFSISQYKKLRYVYESMSTFSNLNADIKFQYYKFPRVFLRRYWNKKFHYNQFYKNNFQQILYSVYALNSSKNKNYIMDDNKYAEKRKQSKYLRREDRKLYFFKIKNKLMNRKKVLIFEQARRDLFLKRLKKISFQYDNVSKLTNQQIVEMIKLLCSYNSKTKTFPFLYEPHPIYKHAKTNFEIGKACILYLRNKTNKKKTKQFLKKMRWSKKEIKFLSMAKKKKISLMNFFTPEYTIRNVKPIKKDIDINYYLNKVDQNTLNILYKSFDKVFIPILIASKFPKRIYKNKIKKLS